MSCLRNARALGAAALLLSALPATAQAPWVRAQELLDGHDVRLAPEELARLMAAGGTVESVAANSGNVRTWVHGADGRMVATIARAEGDSTADGTWRVTEDGLYCVDISWKQVRERWCRAAYRMEGALYLAPADLQNQRDRSFGRLAVAREARGPALPGAPAAIDRPAVAGAPAAAPAERSPPGADRSVRMIYMGGNDCPPCVAWRSLELPKLQKMKVFERVRYVHVVKSIPSPVPARAFLPEEVKPVKDMLDEAGAGNRGSSQTAIVVDGKVFDYYWGSRSAEGIAARLEAILAGGTYPFERCTRLVAGRSDLCAARD